MSKFTHFKVTEEINKALEKNSLNDKKEEIIDQFWLEVTEKISNKEVRINNFGHNNKLIELNNLLYSGKKWQEIVKEEEKFKYEFERQLTYVKKRFNEKIESFFILIELLYLNEKNIVEKLIAKTVEEFFAHSECIQCGCKLFKMNKNAKAELCKMDIPKTQTVEIDVPSGKLWISDWFRDSKNILKSLVDVENTDVGKELIKINEYGAKYGITYLNEYATVLSAAEKNVATVFVGNSCPQIYQNNTTLLIADEYEFDNSSSVGKVCTDLWRTTIVDEDVLKKHIENICGQENMEEVLSEMKEGDINFVDVTPGKYKLTFNIAKELISDEQGSCYMKLELI